MQTKSMVLVVSLCAGLGLSGCDRVKSLLGGGKPTGQVVATVDGEEITALELRQELGGFSSRDAKVMKAAQDRAIEQLIIKKLIVKAAEEQKLDKSAEFANQMAAGKQNLLIQSYQRKLAQSVALPSRQEAEALIASRPMQFAQRRVMVVEQVVAPMTDKIKPTQLQVLKTLDEVRGLYESLNLPSQRNVSVMDTLTTPSQLVEQIDRLPQEEVFVVPNRGNLIFNRVISTHSVPFTGEPAIAYATNALRTQKAQEVVSRRVELMRKSAEKSIVYNASYKPAPKTAKSPAKAAPATAEPTAGAPATAAPAGVSTSPAAKAP